MAEEYVRSKGYMTFLIVFMGFTALLDQYLSLIESTATTYLLDDFNIGISTFSFWQGIVGIMAFFVFLISWLGDNYGRRWGILVLLLVMSIPATLIGLLGNTSFALFIILYGIMIMGTNVNFWAVPISEESPAKKRALYGSTVFLIGLIPLYAFIGVPIAETYGWQWTYGIFGIFGLLLIIPWFFMKETKRWEDNQEEFKDQKDTIVKTLKLFERKDWIVVATIGGVYVCWSTAFKFATTTLVLYFVDVQGYTPEEWTSILTIAGLLTIVGALTIGQIMERLGRIFGFVWAIGGSALSFLGLSFIGSPLFMWGVYFFMSSVLGFLLVYSPEMLPTKIRGTGVGLLSTVSRLGFVLGPLIASIILPEQTIPENIGSYQTLYLVGGIIMLLPFISLLIVRYDPRGKTLETVDEEVSEDISI